MAFVLDRVLKNNAAATPTPWNMAMLQFNQQIISKFEGPFSLWDMVQQTPFTGSVAEKTPAFADMTAGRHTPGAVIDGQNVKKEERVIFIEDEETIAFTHKSKVDDIIEHIQSTPQYAAKSSQALRRLCNKHSFMQLINTARVAARVSGEFPGGNSVTVTSGGATQLSDVFPKSLSGSQALQNALGDLQQQYTDKEIPPEMDKFCFLPSYLMGVLAQDPTLLSRDYDGAEFNSLIKRKVMRVEDFWIIETPAGQMPLTDMSAANGTDIPYVQGVLSYRGDFSKVAAATCTSTTLKALVSESITPAMDWIPQQRVYMIGAAMMKGIGSNQYETAGTIEWSA